MEWEVYRAWMIIVSHWRIKSQTPTTKFAFERLGFCGLTCDICAVLFLPASNHILLNLGTADCATLKFLTTGILIWTFDFFSRPREKKKHSFHSDLTIPSRANSRQMKMMFALRKRRGRKKQLDLFFFTLYAGKRKWCLGY